MKKYFIATVAALAMALGATLITTSLAQASNNDGNSTNIACPIEEPQNP
jgi:hypothetical protein